jgi:hypothetical protein
MVINMPQRQVQWWSSKCAHRGAQAAGSQVAQSEGIVKFAPFCDRTGF